MSSRAGLRCCIPFFAALAVAGCESTPEWVGKPPQETAAEVFFTGSGSDPSGDTAKAEEAAENSLLSAVTRYLGVRISSETTVEARSTLSTYEAEITELIREESAAYISDLKIVDKHVTRNRDGSVIVRLLGSYERSALAAEKERLAALFAERIEAVAGPERAGDAYAAAGALYAAVTSYLRSAAAALKSEIDNAEIVFQRVLSKAVETVSEITVQRVAGPESAIAGKAMDGDFAVSASGPAGGLPGVPFEVTWTERRSGGRVGFSAATIETDTKGIASFTHPPPAYAGDGLVYFSVTFAGQLQPLKLAAGRADEIIRGFERAVAQKTVEFTFPVVSESMAHSTAVYVVEKSEHGRTISINSQTGAGISAALAKAGFTIVPFVCDRCPESMDAGVFFRAVGDRVITEARRVVFGSAEIVEVSIDGGVHLVSAKAELQVVDLETETIVYTIDGSRTARGRSREAAVTAAFRELGEQLGRSLVRVLP